MGPVLEEEFQLGVGISAQAVDRKGAAQAERVAGTFWEKRVFQDRIAFVNTFFCFQAATGFSLQSLDVSRG